MKFRKKKNLYPPTPDEAFFREVAFLHNEEHVNKAMEEKKQAREKRFLEAKKQEILLNVDVVLVLIFFWKIWHYVRVVINFVMIVYD